MPELPEVETVANGVNARVRGERIVAAWFSDKREPMKTHPAVMERVLTGAVIRRVHRVGKTVVMDLAREDGGPQQMLVHLGMTGQLLVNDSELPRATHTHMVLSLADGRELRFVDPRRFGRLSIFGMEGPDLGRGGKRGQKKSKANSKTKARGPSGKSPQDEDALLKNGAEFSGSGAEPLTINMEAFRELFRGRKTPIKAALLNQKLLHGVGNIYADEALFRAGVRPGRQAARVTRVEMERLRVGLVEVLRQAIALGGSSVSDYVDADGMRGFFQLEHRVYQRTGEPCLVCGRAIRKLVIGGRSSHFCPHCQK
jgi:formamidopyrimidine-DNA glycosylase